MSKRSKKIRLKLEYINLELEEIDELSKKYEEAFNEEFREEIAFLNSSKIGEKKTLTKSNDETPVQSALVQKIYRNLAKKLHPDVSKEDNADEIFKEVTLLYEKDDLVGLISISNKYNIILPPFTEQELSVIDNYISEKEKSINKIKNTVPWMYCCSEGDKEMLKSKVYEIINFDVEGFRKWKLKKN